MEKTMKKTWVVFLCAILCCLLWGSAFPCVKLGYKWFGIGASDSAAQLLFAGIRFTLAGILTILIGSGMQKKALKPARTSWGMVFRLCMLQTVLQYLFFYIGLAHTSGVKSSIIEGANVFLSILAACFLFHMEKMTYWKAAGCLVGFAGVVLINLGGGTIDWNFSLLGEGFVLLSTVAYAFSSVMIKRYSQKENPVTLSGYQFLCGGIILSVCALAAGGRIDFGHAAAGAFPLLLYMAFISAAAYSVWGVLLKYNPVGRVAVFGFMNPVFGVLLSALLLGEGSQAFGLTGIIALALVCIGIYLVNFKQET